MSVDAFRSEARRLIEGEWDPITYRADLESVTTSLGPAVGHWHRYLQKHRLIAPQFPEEYGGRGLTLRERVVVTEELDRAGALPPANGLGVGWVAPTILAHGTDVQKERFIVPLLEGDEIWCQLFSEPGAGSDLAGLSTLAERDGDEWAITGQKVWTSGAHFSDYGILLARTDRDARKHRGLTYFLVPMRQPGVEVRTIRQMTGEAEFCEVFFDGARVSSDAVLGAVDDGWRVAITTLMNERISLSTGLGMLWGSGRSFSRLWTAAIAQSLSPVGRDALTRSWIRHRIVQLLEARAVDEALALGVPGPGAAIQKLMVDSLAQDLLDDMVDGAGMRALVDDGGPLFGEYLFSRALTIGGGTEEVQKNIIAERVLGLS